jgi:hypothetical protein
VQRLPRPTIVEWLLLVFGLVLTIQYAWILDDAYVYFRYVDNLVVYDFGWVYNDGEYVEGYTSPAWLVILTLLRLIGIDYWLLVRGLGLVCFVAFWLGLVVLDRELSPRGDVPLRNGLLNLPLIFLSLGYGTLSYFTSGVEAPLAQVVAVGYALFLVRPQNRVAAVLVGISPLVRPELLLALVLALGFAWWRTRRLPVFAICCAAALIGTWELFRIYYYADLLPNTFYLKDTNLYRQGLLYVQQSLTSYGVYPVAVIAIGLAWLLRRRGAAIDVSARLAMLVIAAAITLYIVRVGGDPRHHRYMIFAFCLAAASMAGLGGWTVSTFLPWARPSALSAVALTAAMLFGSLHPPQLSSHPLDPGVVHSRFGLINDAEFHRRNSERQPPAWSLDPLGINQPMAVHAARQRFRSGYTGIVTVLGCGFHYWHIDKQVVHGAGLTDAVLARMRVPRPVFEMTAHNRNMKPIAGEIARIHDGKPGRIGMYRDAVERGEAPAWVAPNLDSLERIERKIYNQHDFFGNLRLALQPVPRLEVARYLEFEVAR